MKKQLLTLFLVVSSCFFAYAQYDVNGVKVNVGQVQGTVDGKNVIVNPTSGQYQVTDANGNRVYVNGQGGVSAQAGGIGVTYGNQSGANGNTIANTNFGVASGRCTAGQGIIGLMGMVSCVLAMFVPILISMAVVGFFWFVVQFLWKGADNPEEQRKAKSGMFWSIIAIFVMVSIWGVIGFLGNITGIKQGGSIDGFKLPGEQ